MGLAGADAWFARLCASLTVPTRISMIGTLSKVAHVRHGYVHNVGRGHQTVVGSGASASIP